ncbi:HTH domain-containing protein [Fulvivirgaceae bacterium BMA12]|uniref:HTH domain-containing protein n=1 Tax=Agaribacillus aureus TaxID=3051825 RepID=A0ABT8LFS1_9BACT|nr:HTH domain-containing protein [Fulvivirgaceae bacterium BMA12]
MKIERIKRIDHLIRLAATGGPDELAEKLQVSRMTIFRDLVEMKKSGSPIKYSHFNNSYIYTKAGKFYVGFLKEDS